MEDRAVVIACEAPPDPGRGQSACKHAEMWVLPTLRTRRDTAKRCAHSAPPPAARRLQGRRTFPRQLDEVLAGLGRLALVELQNKGAHAADRRQERQERQECWGRVGGRGELPGRAAGRPPWAADRAPARWLLPGPYLHLWGFHLLVYWTGACRRQEGRAKILIVLMRSCDGVSEAPRASRVDQNCAPRSERGEGPGQSMTAGVSCEGLTLTLCSIRHAH